MVNPCLYASLILAGVVLLSSVHLTWHLQHQYARHFQSPPQNESEFDFVVVGSGSSGSVVAARYEIPHKLFPYSETIVECHTAFFRLAEAGNSVLLLEAGGPSHPLQSLLAFAMYFMEGPYDWNYYSEPSDKAFKAMADKRYPKKKAF